MNGILQYAISIVYPQPRAAEGWLNKECTSLTPFDEQRAYGSLCVHPDQHAAENIMSQLANARFEDNRPHELAGALYKKMCLIGELDNSNQYGFIINVRSGVKLCLWKVMISELGIVHVKERLDCKVELRWFDLASQKVNVADAAQPSLITVT
jgi:hypothetical protein